ncbi:N-acetyltransferase [Paraburkholderia hospita]|nr:N-acetyltransferase [Paraburkholderia hospita]
MRLAVSCDTGSLIEMDSIAQRDSRRRAFIESAIAGAQCWIATDSDDVPLTVGYGVLNRTFFAQNFVPLVVVRDTARRRGVGIAILSELETQCRGTKLFTSTNASNAPMRGLLLRCGFRQSGRIDNLDDGDTELIFMKLATAQRAHDAA